MNIALISMYVACSTAAYFLAGYGLGQIRGGADMPGVCLIGIAGWALIASTREFYVAFAQAGEQNAGA